MDDLLSEKEQIEQIRNWWSVNGGCVIFGLAAGALLLFGVNYYRNAELEAQLGGSALYEELANHVVDGDLDEAEVIVGELGTTYADTSYAAQARLAISRLYMDKNRDQDAADALRELLAGDADEELKHVARLRLARILLYQDKPQEVIDLLDGMDSPAFAAAYGEVRGDAHHALGQIADAQAAYQRVLVDPLAQGTVNQRLVQWKVLDLPEIETTSDAPQPDDAAGELSPAGGEAAATSEAAEDAAQTPETTAEDAAQPPEISVEVAE